MSSRPRNLLRRPHLLLAASLLPVLPLAGAGCGEDPEPVAQAMVISERDELIGGPSALGQVGDVLIQNDLIRVIIHDAGFSRGSGIFGGDVLDVDLRRPVEEGDRVEGNGHDAFGELFPALFFQAAAVDTVEVVSDGSDAGVSRWRAERIAQRTDVCAEVPEDETDEERAAREARETRARAAAEVEGSERPAVVRASGAGADIFSMLSALDRAALGSHAAETCDEDGECSPISQRDFITALARGELDDLMREYTDNEARPNLRYETDYELLPGQRYMRIRFRIVNVSYDVVDEERAAETGEPVGQRICGTGQTLTFPGELASQLLPLVATGLDLSDFTIPLADVALFGAASPAFLPGFGFDQHFALNLAYQTQEVDFPAFPGLIAEWAATRSDNVSYGLFLEPDEERNFVWNKREVYESTGMPITPSSMLMFIQASGMSAFLEFDAPEELAPGESFEVVKYLAVGHGDVGSVLDVIHEVRGVTTGRIGGEVLDRVSGEPPHDAYVLVYQREGDERRIFSQYDLSENGFFAGTLEPGAYSLRVAGHGRPLSDFTDFEIRAGQVTPVMAFAESAARISVHIVDDRGQRLPARATAIGTYGTEHIGLPTEEFLFDPAVGERFRFTDMIPDTEEARTRRYIEAVEPTVDGVADLVVRPGTYEVITSRGPEYDIQTATVTVGPGQTATVAATLTRVVDTTGWIAADTHIHSENSPDSSAPVERQILRLAAEGIEWAIATDHNYVTDYRPLIARYGLDEWMIGTAGLELTTLDGGHFNAYPLRYDPGPTTHGSFEWSQRPPGDIFDDLRALGELGPENTIVQVNHPRDTVLGYFNQFAVSPLTTEYTPPEGFSSFLAEQGPNFYDEEGNSNFSLDFEALEVLNANRIDILHHYRVPAVLPAGEVPTDVPPPGTILLDEDAEVAFPGAVDDWYNFLNLGERFIGVGASDTHGDKDPAGYGRTLIYTGEDTPLALTHQGLVDAMRRRRVIATNGPLLDFWVNDPASGAMGQTINDADGTITVSVRLTAAPWISLSRINVVRNGLIAHVIEVDPDRNLAADPLEEEFELLLASDDEGNAVDSWFTVEAVGYRSMFPIVWPYEQASIVIGDAVGQIAEPLGFADEFGALRPALTFPVAAYALTNPVWVIAGDGDEFTPPGVAPVVELQLADNDPGVDQNPRLSHTIDYEATELGRPIGQAHLLGHRRPDLIIERMPRARYDLRSIFTTFSHH